MVLPVAKRGGVRRAGPKKPKNRAVQLNAENYFRDVKDLYLLKKRLGSYRFIFYTNFDVDDLAALIIFTAWVKVNEKYFESRNHFPIYGFIVPNSRVQTQRAREFLAKFANILQWDDPDHHHYEGFISAGSRIWNDGSNEDFTTEENLLDNPDVLTEEDYPDSTSNFEDLFKVKPDNLFMVYLKEPLLKDDFFKSIPSVSLKPLTTTALTLYADIDETVNEDNATKLFTLFDEAEEDEMAYLLNKAMYIYNDHNDVTEYNARVFSCAGAGLIMALLTASGTLKKVNSFEKTGDNTYVLKAQKDLAKNMLLAAFKVLGEYIV